MVDLADAKKAANVVSRGTALEEVKKINQSLSTLSKVIKSLTS